MRFRLSISRHSVALALIMAAAAACTEEPTTSAVENASSPATPSPLATRAGIARRTPANADASGSAIRAKPAAQGGAGQDDRRWFHIDAQPSSGTAPLRVRFNAAGKFPAGTSLTWDFGDGSPTENGPTASHTYQRPGQYAASLQVVGPDGVGSQAATIVVDMARLEFEIDAAPDIGPAPLTVQFSAVLDEDRSGPLDFRWNFGDGAGDVHNPTSHTYTAPGEYSASLTITDEAGQSTQRAVQIFVDPPPEGGQD